MASIDLGANTGTGGTSGGGGGGGTVTQVQTGAGLVGGPITSTGTISVASVSLTNQVSGNLPLSQTSGSLSLTNQVVNNLPLTQTSGSLSLTNQVVGNLPLTQTSGSLSLSNQISGVLPLANGGTGVTALDSASFFAVGGNTLGINQTIGTKDNFALQFITNGTASMAIDSLGNLNVGWYGPPVTSTTQFTLNRNATSPPASGSFTSLHICGQDGINPTVLLDSFGTTTQPILSFRKAGGTNASKAACSASSVLAAIGGTGFGSTIYVGSNRALMTFNAAENWTDTTTGTYIAFQTTLNNTMTRAEKVRIDNAGNFSIGVASASAQLHTTSTVRFAGLGAGVGLLDSSGNLTGGSVSLSTNVSGVLPTANGGLGTTVATNQFASNLGIFATVGSSNLSVLLKQSDGLTDPSTGTSAVTLAFKTISSSGAYSLVSRTSALSILAPSGASLGLTSSVNQYAWVYAINDSGVIDLGLSGSVFNEGTLCSATSISATSTNVALLYSSASHSASVAVRIIGRIQSNQNTAGTWNTLPNEVSTLPTPVTIQTDWVSYTPTFLNGPTTNFTATGKWKRVGDTMWCMGNIAFSGAAGTFTRCEPSIPSGFTIDTTKILDTTTAYLGNVVMLDFGSADYDGSVRYNTTTNVVCAVANAGSAFGYYAVQKDITASVPVTWGNQDDIAWTFQVPIKGWTAYGP